jgi:AcrR family transcriptional regulator
MTAQKPGRKPADPQRRRSPAALRTLILEAARVEFGAQGYKATSNRDVARRAGVALSVLYRHFDTKAELFSEAVMEPFVRAFERLGSDWLGQLGEPLSDEELMELFVRDMLTNLADNQHALEQLGSGRAELPEAMVERIRIAFEKLITQLRLMTEFEAKRRPWMSALGVDMSVRVLMGMVMGMSVYGWVLLPEDKGAYERDVIESLVKLGLWGMTKRRDGPISDGGKEVTDA